VRSKETRIPEDTYLSLMEAVVSALNKHGYGDLTMRNIADEFDRSRGLLHYHFEDKGELLSEVWEFVFERHTREVEFEEGSSAEERVETFLSATLFGTGDGDLDHWEVQTALLEFQMAARHDEWLRSRFEAAEERRIRTLAGCIEDGIEDGEFRPVDPEEVALFLLGAAEAARVRTIYLGWDDATEQYWNVLTGVILPGLRAGTE
jgi:AcrR family transcriptional regulator